MPDVVGTLKALREGVTLISGWSEKPSILSRLRHDIDLMWVGCKDLWDSVGDRDEDDYTQELSAFRSSNRSYGVIRDEWGDGDLHMSSSSSRHSCPEESLTTRENAPHVGSTLAASMGTSVSSVLPTVLIGTQSLHTTIVKAGTQVAIPQYTLVNGQLVVDHYNILTASSPIQGWFPHGIVTLPVSTIPVFAATFALTHALDSVHSYVNNRCSFRAAVANVLTGTVSGGVVGGIYYAAVSAAGMAHAPLISAGLCLGWLGSTYFTRSNVSSSDLMVGALANVAGLTTFLVSSSPWLSVLAALGGSLAASGALAWLSQKWAQHLRSRLSETARAVLGVSAEATRNEIESAYRQLARKHHPDKQGSREYFELIQVSKELLLLNFSEPKLSDSFRLDLLGLMRSLTDSFMATPAPPRPKPQLELPIDFLGSPD